MNFFSQRHTYSGMYKVFLLEEIHPLAVKQLQESGIEVQFSKNSLTEEEVISKAQDFHGLGVRSKTAVTKNLIQNLPSLLTLGAFCVGVNKIDVSYAMTQGIPVFNSPYSNTRSVAELVLGEVICLYRRTFQDNQLLHEGVWKKESQGRHEVRGKTLGIVGYGHIGSQVSVLAESIGMNVVYYDIIKKLPLGNAKPLSSLKELLKVSDAVTIHVPETELTKNMMNEKTFSFMKDDSYLLNLSRGTVVDIPSFISQLKSGKIKGGALDVFPEEPKNKKSSFVSELQKFPQVILTPHIGGSTEEAQRAIGLEVARSFIDFFYQGRTEGSVDFPSLNVPAKKDSVLRICHVHKNISGVLGAVNGIISEMKMNTVSQHLSTRGEFGYLVMDLENALSQKDEIFKRIQNLDETIKLRFC